MDDLVLHCHVFSTSPSDIERRRMALRELAEANLWPYTVVHTKDEFVPAHRHRVDEVLYLLHGRMMFRAVPGDKSPVEMKPGEKLRLQRGVVHEVRVFQATVYLMGLSEPIDLDSGFMEWVQVHQVW